MENKGIWPCVRCTENTFRNRIAHKLKKWGYILHHIDRKFGCCNTIVIKNNKHVVNSHILAATICDRYLCKGVSEFLHDAQEVAIREGWFKKETKEAENLI